MTLETIRTHLPAVESSTLPVHLAELRAWAETYNEVARFVAPLVDTPFVPAAFRPEAFVKGRPDEAALAAARETAIASATAAVLYGAAIGFDPLTALQNVYVVGGRPGLYAAAMVAIVQAAGHEVWTEDITDARAVVCGRRKGGSEERVVVTIDQAKKAGWTRNAKYQTEPQSMLWARAASTVCRRIAQDALKGIARSVEELSDEAVVEVGPARTVARKAVEAPTRAAAPAAAPAQGPAPAAERVERPAPGGLPPLPGEEPAEQASVDPAAPGSITERQMRDLGAAFGRLGVGGTGSRARRQAIVGHLLGRTAGPAAELSEADAKTVIDTLEALDGERLRQLEAEISGHSQAGDAEHAETGDTDPETDSDGEQLPDPADGNDPWAGAGE